MRGLVLLTLLIPLLFGASFAADPSDPVQDSRLTENEFRLMPPGSRPLQLAHGFVEATSVRCQAVLDALRGRFDAARAMLESSRRTSEELGLRMGLMETKLYAGIVELLADEPAAAEAHLRVAHAGLDRLDLHPHLSGSSLEPCGSRVPMAVRDEPSNEMLVVPQRVSELHDPLYEAGCVRDRHHDRPVATFDPRRQDDFFVAS